MATATAERGADARETAEHYSEKPPARSSRWLALALLASALVMTFAAQARTLTFYFFQDDYVGFSEIVTQGTPRYVWNLVTVQDLTPNWRVMTGLTYLANYHVFGMRAWATHIVMILLHLVTVALLFRATWWMASSVWAAFAAALVFGISPAYAGTFGQLGSVTYAWAAFFLAAALCCCIKCARAEDGPRSYLWLAGGVVLYVLALASNESMAIMFPVFALVLLLLDDDGDLMQRSVRAGLRALPFAALGLTTAVAFTACDCTAAEDTFGITNTHRAFLIYLGRLVYPVGLEAPTHIDGPHLMAGLGLAAFSVGALAFGNAAMRVGVLWLLLAIAPHALIEDHTAHRFLYVATVGFALLSGGVIAAVEPHARRLGPAGALTAAALMFVLVAPWYAWQTHRENDAYARLTGDWRLLHDEVESTFPRVPPGATVEVVGGPLTHPLDNFFVMPALAQTIWGPDVKLQTFAEDDPYVETLRASGNAYTAEFEGRALVPLR